MTEYETVDGDVVEAWTRTHKTDEQTAVAVVDVDEIYLAVAMDIDPEGDVIATELIDSALTDSEAVERAKRWIDDNPKGIKGDSALGGLLG